MVIRAFSLGMLLIAVVGMGLQYRFLRIMRVRHPELWRSLGKPRWYPTSNLLLTSPVLRFLWHRDYCAVPDQEFATLGGIVRFYHLMFVCIFILFVIALAVSARPTI